MNDFYKFITTFFGLITDAGSLAWEYIVNYFNFLWRMTKWFALFAAIPIPVLIICLSFGWHVNWLYSAYRIFVGGEVVILMILAFPIILAAQIIFDKFPQFADSIRKSVQIIAAVAFWVLMSAIYFYIIPVWQNPKMIPLVLMAAAALAVGTYAGSVRLHFGYLHKIATISLVGIFVMATVAIAFPNRTQQFVGLLQNIDKPGSEPKRVKVESPDQIQFVNIKTGEPQIWYYRSPTGEYELYDHDGFHSSGMQLKPAKTVEERNQIMTWFRDQARRAKEDRDKAEGERNQIAQNEKKKADDLAQQQAQEQASQKRETFKNTYLRDRSFLNLPETKEAAVVMVDDKMINQTLGESVAAIFDAKGLRTTTTLFTDRFVTDDLFEKFFNGGGFDEIAALELASNADLLILGKRTASFTTNSDLQNAITAKVTLKAKTILVKSAQVVDTFNISETGVGFSNEAAVATAMEKILKQVNYSINPKEKLQ